MPYIEFKTTEGEPYFSFKVTGLDGSYEYSDRVYSGFIKEAESRTYRPCYPSFTGFVPANGTETIYSSKITAIADIDGNPTVPITFGNTYDILVVFTVGGSDIVEVSGQITTPPESIRAPVIEQFYVTYIPKSEGVRIVWDVSNLVPDALIDNIYNYYLISLWVKRDDGYYRRIKVDPVTGDGFATNDSMCYEYVGAPFENGNYTFRLSVTNVYGDIEKNAYEEFELTISGVGEAPRCVLEFTLSDVAFSYSNVSGTLKKCPKILADDWNSFFDDVNIVRNKAGILEFGGDLYVSPGDNMTAERFNSLRGAIVDIYNVLKDESGVTIPSAIIDPFKQHSEITDTQLIALESLLMDLRDYLYYFKQKV